MLLSSNERAHPPAVRLGCYAMQAAQQDALHKGTQIAQQRVALSDADHRRRLLEQQLQEVSRRNHGPDMQSLKVGTHCCGLCQKAPLHSAKHAVPDWAPVVALSACACLLLVHVAHLLWFVSACQPAAGSL